MKSFKNSGSKPSKSPDMLQNLPMLVETTALHTGTNSREGKFCSLLSNLMPTGRKASGGLGCHFRSNILAIYPADVGCSEFNKKSISSL